MNWTTAQRKKPEPIEQEKGSRQIVQPAAICSPDSRIHARTADSSASANQRVIEVAGEMFELATAKKAEILDGVQNGFLCSVVGVCSS